MKLHLIPVVLISILLVAGCGGDSVQGDLDGAPDALGTDNPRLDVNTPGDDVVPEDAGLDLPGQDAVESDGGGDSTEPVDVVDPDSSFDSDVPVVSTEVNYLVIASDSLLESASELAEYRQSRGFRTQVMTRSDILGGTTVSTANWTNMARAHINKLFKKLPAEETLFVVLVGDVEDVPEEGFTKPLPTTDCDNVLTGICFTDNSIADLDDDYIPDVALGRITASNNQEVRDYLQKVVNHEAGYTPGLWNRRVSLYVGEAGFSPEIDATLEYFTFQGLDLISHAFDIIGAYDSENSSYYYTPFHEKVVELINQGSLMSIYIGHGSEDWTQGLETDQLPEIKCENRLPVMVFLACLNGNFDWGDDSIAEAMMHLPDGPVAVFASSDESHPVGNAVLAYEVTRVGLGERPLTAGELFMRTKAELINHSDDFRQTIDGASIAYGEQGADDPERLYREHADLYNLLGDPAVMMKYPPASVSSLDVNGTLAGKQLTVSGNVSGFVDGRAYVTLEVSRNEFAGELNQDPESDAEIQANWEIANDKVVAAETVDVMSGVFVADLSWDRAIGGGDRYIKVYAWDGSVLGQGTVDAIGEKRINK